MRKLLLSWLLSSAVMFGLFYLWHAYLLTDIHDVEYSITLFLILTGIVYLLLGGALYGILNYLVTNKLFDFNNKFPWKSMLVGAILGFSVYLITFILGLSFSPHGLEHILVDFVWQMFEQAMGGLVVALAFIYDARRAQFEFEGA